MLMYRDGRHYDAMNGAEVHDAHFYVERAKQLGGPGLELCCGTGRLTLPIARAGIDITGLDLAPGMLREARRKASAAGLSRIEWVEGDCRNFSLGQSFRFILAPYNSLLHLSGANDWQQFFTSVKRHMDREGQLVFDVFSPQISGLSEGPGVWGEMLRYADPDGRGEILIEERRRYDEPRRAMQIEWRYSLAGRPNIFPNDTMSMACILPAELDALIEENGFRVREKFGDFEGSAFNAESRRQIVVCVLA